jgi:hypothetical protein
MPGVCEQQTTTKQTITYCGVSAHDQNGIAERAKCTICDSTCTVLINAMKTWPQVVNIDLLWPSAFKMAMDIQNATPG